MIPMNKSLFKLKQVLSYFIVSHIFGEADLLYQSHQVIFIIKYCHLKTLNNVPFVNNGFLETMVDS